MSVYIKGMKMPESCHECVAGYGGCCYVAPADADGICPDHGRADFCPLIEVHDHGRLIDADALVVVLETQDYSGAPDTLEDWTPMDMTKAELADIKAAPTVIPASKEGET